MLRKISQIIFYFFSALFLILAYPPFNLWIFAWFSFLPLFFVLERKSGFKAFVLAYVFGIIFWLVSIYWLIYVTLLGLISLVLYLALYFAFFGWFFKTFSKKKTAYLIFSIPCLWVLLEYLRSHLFSGFPWLLLGHSQYLNLAFIQIADFTGAYGVSFLIMFTNLCLWQVFRSIKRESIWALCFCVMAILATWGYGNLKLKEVYSGKKFSIAVIQPNIPQELKWQEKEKDRIIYQQAQITLKTSDANPDLVIWPETALPLKNLDLEEDIFSLLALKNLAQELKSALLTGAVRIDKQDYYNSAYLISSSGQILKFYDKIHLVPFGEYIPIRKYFSFLESIVPIGDFSAGKDFTIFRLDGARFAVLICFEDIFPELARNFVKKGAHFLINITNDAWFGRSPAAHQHFISSVFRAVENRVWIVRSANTGVSGFISPSGKIVSVVKDYLGKEIFVEGYAIENVTIAKNKPLSFYSRYGDVFIIFNLFIFLSILVATSEKKFKEVKNAR